MKKAFFLLLFFGTLVLSCSRKSDRNKEQTSGSINSISVIIDDQLWNGEVGDSIRNKFASPVIGLPKEEPLFTINQYPIRLLEGFTTNSRNILVVKKEPENRFEIVENEFASPQNVFHISGKTATGILQIMEENSAEIIQKMRQTEIAENQRIIDTSLINTQKITNKFNIGIRIPKGYHYAISRKKFVWLKKEITSGNMSILVYQVPISALKNKQNIINNIIRIRDSIGNRYIHGTASGTQMVTEDSYAPYLFNIKIKGKETFETKGTWELRKDFMSGPFINYCIVDLDNARVLVLEGFCYAPSKEKRNLMFELESIIKSTEFFKKKTSENRK